MPKYVIEVKVWDTYSVEVYTATEDDAKEIACQIAESGFNIDGGRDIESIALANDEDDDDFWDNFTTYDDDDEID